MSPGLSTGTDLQRHDVDPSLLRRRTNVAAQLFALTSLIADLVCANMIRIDLVQGQHQALNHVEDFLVGRPGECVKFDLELG